eukprot:gene6254-2881_t
MAGSHASLVRGIHDLGSEISKELDTLADRAYELQIKVKALQESVQPMHNFGSGLMQTRETDTKPLSELYMDVATCDLEAESAYNMTEANLVKMMLQFSQHNVEQQAHAMDLVREERDAVVAAMKRIHPGVVGLESVERGLVKLEKDFHGVADADMDAMPELKIVRELRGC